MAAKFSCLDAQEQIQLWSLVALVIPMTVSFVMIFILIWIIQMIRSLRELTKGFVSSTNWLSSTAVSVGLGPTAKQALAEYAKTKPEIAPLVLS